MFRMFRSSILFLMFISLMTKTITGLAQMSSTESSAEYLHNVMNQLQEHNRPSPVSVDRTTGVGDDFRYYINHGHSSYKAEKSQNEILQTEKPTIHDHHRYHEGRKPQFSTDQSIAFHNDQQFAESVAPYYQISAPQTIVKAVQVLKEPAPLGLTRNDLAILYKKALQQGSPVGLSTLKTSLPSSGHVPQITGNQVRLNSGDPGYYYYFYPLKTFVNELQNNHKHEVIPHNIQPSHTDLAAESSEKQMANPLFMAISGFIGMALIFMASVLFLPRFESSGSRNSSDEFLQLTKVAWEAIEGRNCTERFACELNRVAVKLELSKRSRRLLEDVVPTNLRRQMIRMRKSTKKRQECKLIMCKCA